MTLREIPFLPGVIKDEESYSARGYATDSQLIRWVRGRAEAQGGWEQVLSGISGIVRAMHEWTLVDGRAYLAIATTKKLYVYDGNKLIDITPQRTAAALAADPLATVSGSPIVTVTHTAHGALEGDFVYLNGLAAVGGLQVGGLAVTGLNNPIATTLGSRLVVVTDTAHGLNDNDIVVFSSVVSAVGGYVSADFDPDFRAVVLDANRFQIEMATPATSTATGGGAATAYLQYKGYEIVQVVDADSFTIDAGANASSTASGGGASGAAIWEINVGRENTRPAGGFGSGEFGAGLFGADIDGLYDTIPLPLRQWSLDNMGNTLIACLSGGTTWGGSLTSIFAWPYLNITVRAEGVTNAPAQVICIVATQERFLLALGCTNEDGDFDPLLGRHSTGEDFTVWAPADDNSAGDFVLSGGSRVVGVVRREAGPIVFTDGGMCAIRSIFQFDQVYKAEQIGEDCGLLGMHAVAHRDSDLYWVTPGLQFYTFRGGRPQAMECPNRQWFEDKLIKLQAEKVFAHADRSFEAVTWFLPTSANVEPDEYLRLDIPEQRRNPFAGWSIGFLNRTASSSGGRFLDRKPFMVSFDGVLYRHEAGYAADGEAVARHVQFAPVDLSDGDQRCSVTEIKAEITQAEDITLLLTFRENPRGPSRTRQIVFTPDTQSYDTFGQGRQVDFRVQGTTSTFWRMGVLRLDLSDRNSR